MIGAPSRAEILGVVNRILASLCESRPLRLTAADALADVPNLDSLRMLQVIALLEEHFGIEVDVVALESLHRIDDMLAAVEAAFGPSSQGSYQGSSQGSSQGSYQCRSVETPPNADAPE